MGNLDVEVALTGWLKASLEVRALTDLPADLAGALPVIQVTRIGGADVDDNPRFDVATVDIDTYAAARAAASSLAGRVHDALRVTLRGQVLEALGDTATITLVQTVTGPAWRPYENTTLRRFGATYRLHLKSRS